ncbi:putative serine protease inhibitor i/ii, partial [Operophtera brumata]
MASPFSVSTCIPNSQFQINGHICYCDGLGRWSEANCEISRCQYCQPGQIIWEGCKQCICQEKGEMQCISTACDEDKSAITSNASKDLVKENISCLPFVSYYINCSLCVCPASGKLTEARCATDASCPFQGSSDLLETVKQNICIPKVMYLFPCHHCQCSNDGFFVIDKCVETCSKPQISDSASCVPETFYRKDCNICWCPKNSIASEEMCSKAKCNNRFELYSLSSLRNRTEGCHRNKFTSPKCFFCECNQNATVNENCCLESECMNNYNPKYGLATDKCGPGEMVAFCTECLCLRNGLTDPKYCTSVCSHQHKLIMLEIGIEMSLTNHTVIDKGSVKNAASNGACEPNSIYLDNDKYCLCPDSGNTKFKLCTSITDRTESEGKKVENNQRPNTIDFTATCDPSTFVEFDCNTCYCLKSGKLDPKWCTYDDCEAKRITNKQHENTDDIVTPNGNCVAGSITKEDCNFCICPSNGQLKDRVCTNTTCTELRHSTINDKFSCEPLLYYNVDCNICFCPKSGLKNVAKCTKNICEKSFLRSEACIPSELFSENCNVCVCPPNGEKLDRACTNHICSEADTPWKKIFQLSRSLLSNHVTEDTARRLELCFPGEEFEVGCKVCVCPDMGLRVHATCTPILCGDDGNRNEISISSMSREETSKTVHLRTKRSKQKTCKTSNITDTSVKECTPAPTESQEKEETRPPHNHTLHACDQSGEIRDDCFVCDCVDRILVAEHCFQNDAETCRGRKPTFLEDK